MSDRIGYYPEIQHILTNPKPGDQIVSKVVAVIGYSGRDWAAYMGPVDWSIDMVARAGDKVSKEMAEALYPDLGRRLNYRA